MKTNRRLILLVAFLFCWFGVVCAAGAANVKGAAQSQQGAAPAAAGPAKAVQVKDIQPTVVIISPAEGETWYGGETRDIQWTTMAIPDSFKIKIRFVSSDKGEYVVADGLPRSGKFSWNIGAGPFQTKQVPTSLGGTWPMPVDTAGKLKVIAYDGGNKYEREAPLSLAVPRLKITSPKQGDTWKVGQTYTVTWNNIGIALSPIQVNIQTGGGFVSPFLYSGNMTNNTGSASITVPASSLLDSTSYFRVVVLTALASFPGPYVNDEVPIKIVK